MAPVTTRRRRFRRQSGKANNLVMSALTKLKHNTGWTPKTIAKFIQTELGKGDVTDRTVSQALRQGVTLGLVKVDSNKYRLMSVAERNFGELTDKGRRRRKGRSRGKSRRKGRRGRSKSGKRSRRRRRRR